MTENTEKYQNGAEGFIKWVEDYVCLAVYPIGSKVRKWLPFDKFPVGYKLMWEEQKKILRECLVMDNGEFRYSLIVLMWPRGEGKSILAVLIPLWRICNFPGIVFILGANSVTQIRFMHFEVMTRIITRSPKLLQLIGRKNLQQKQIQIRDAKGGVVSYIRPVSSETGLFSGIDGYTFCEFHKAKQFNFFDEIDSSMRGIKNGLGIIDTTVASKTHVLYKLWQTHLTRKDPKLYFSYRSTNGNADEFWNPEIDQEYLDSQKEKRAFGSYERFFLNKWSAAQERVFTDEMIEATSFLGVNKRLNSHTDLIALLTRKNKLIDDEKRLIEETGMMGGIDSKEQLFQSIDEQLWPVEDFCRLKTDFATPKMVDCDELDQLSNLYDTDWAILTGVDRADPMKERTGARSIVVALAKGFIGSRTNLYSGQFGTGEGGEEEEVARYLYLLLGLWDVGTHDLDDIKDILLLIQGTYDGIDSFGGERWGIVDLEKWFVTQEIEASIYSPTYDKQRTMFSMFFLACKLGLFKAPPLAVRGSREDDILKEEMKTFDHNTDGSAKFGSIEKWEKGGSQDDVMYAIGGALYGGKMVGVDKFRPRRGIPGFAFFYEDKGLLGRY